MAAYVTRKPLLFKGGKPSNWYLAPFELDVPFLGQIIEFQRNENYFQAMKIVLQNGSEKQFLKIAWASSAGEAKALGRKVPLTKSEREEWDRRYALTAMLECNLAKFTQNPHCRSWLLDTGDRPLVEHRPDPIWGDNLDGTGLNLQGKLLEVVRMRVCK